MAGKIKPQKVDAYQLLKKKLFSVVRKYILIKSGANFLASVVLFVTLGLIQVLINELLDLSTGVRTVLFWIALSISVIHLLNFSIKPLIQWLINCERKRLLMAERLLRAKYSELADRLINTIELAEDSTPDKMNDLVSASIGQKVKIINAFPIDKLISLRALVRSFSAGVVLLGIVVLVKLIAPNTGKKGFARTIHHGTEISILENFNFLMNEDGLKVLRGEDFIVDAEITFNAGNEPVYIVVGADRFEMDVEENEIRYVLKAPNRDIDFFFMYRNIESKSYTLKVTPGVEMQHMLVRIFPPAHTAMPVLMYSETGSLEVPEGSQVEWNISYFNAVSTSWISDKDTVMFRGNELKHLTKVHDDQMVRILALGEMAGDSLGLVFNLKASKDLFPEIRVVQTIDTISGHMAWYQGFIQDDFGFNALRVLVNSIKGIEEVYDTIAIDMETTSQNFFYAIDFASFTDGVGVTFEVLDNDAINGFKSSKSNSFYLRVKSMDEIIAESQKKLEDILSSAEQSNDVIDKMMKHLDDLRKNQITKEYSRWEIQEKMTEVLKLRDEIEKTLDQIKIQQEVRFEMEKAFMEEELLRKAEEIQKLFEELIDEELMQLMEEFEKLLEEKGEKLNPDDTRMLEMSLENMQKKMERDMELLKRFEVEKEVMQQANELEKLKEKIEKDDNSDIREERKEEFNEWKEKAEEWLDKNEKLKEPFETDEIKKQIEELGQEMGSEKGNDSKSGGENKGGNEKKEVSKKMDKLASDMKNMIGFSSEEETVDMEEIRKIVRALNQLSMEHEALFSSVSDLALNHSTVTDVMIRERGVKNKFDRLKDSLEVFGFRQPMISRIISKELFHVETSFVRMFDHFEGGRASAMKVEQNKIMAYMNDVAVKLDEIVKSMDQAKANAQGKGGFMDSRKKQSGEDEIGDMKGKQQSMKEQLKSQIEQMKNSGQQGKEGKERLAKMLGEREMMRKKMEQLARSGAIGQNAKEKINQAVEMMEEVEKDIIYNNLGDHTFEKDEWITTKLLEAENAERERDEEEERESREFKGQNEEIVIPGLDEWKRVKKGIEEQRYRDIKLREFYDKLYRDYLKKLEKEK